MKVKVVKPITSEEVKVLEKALESELEEDFIVIFDVIPNTLVEANSP